MLQLMLTQWTGDGLANHRDWQLPSFVKSVPTGTEKGTFLAVDLGGSNCRICLVELHGNSTFAVTQSRHRVPPDVMVCQSYKPLFNFIAEKIADFLVAHPVPDLSETQERRNTPCRLGFTFSFTCEQTSLAGGRLIRWDKDWDIPDAVGRDPCVMLQEAIDKRGLPVLVTVLANDSVGTLLTRSYTTGSKTSTLAAIIFGTGTNAAYVENVSNIKRLGPTGGQPGDVMVINTEWGSLDDKMEVLPRTPFDDEIDENSSDPGAQMFEKRVSGLYLGELLRLALLRLVRDGAFEMIFDEESQLFRRQGIESSFLSELAVSSSKTDSSQSVKLITDKLSAKNVTAVDVQAIKLLSAAIVRRAARLAGASLAAIIIQSGRLDQPLSASKYPDTEVTECQTSETIRTARPTSIGRFCHRLSLLWRRTLKLFTGLNSSSKTQLLSTVNSSQRSPKLAEVRDPQDQVIDIAADGSLIEFYPTFEADMREAMQEVQEIGPAGERRVCIGLAKDGSGVGAALMAQAALQTETIAE
jgi:hexokinase